MRQTRNCYFITNFTFKYIIVSPPNIHIHTPYHIHNPRDACHISRSHAHKHTQPLTADIRSQRDTQSMYTRAQTQAPTQTLSILNKLQNEFVAHLLI